MTDQHLLDALTRANVAYGNRRGLWTPDEPWLGDPRAWHDAMTEAGYRILNSDFSGSFWVAVTVQDATVAGRASAGRSMPRPSWRRTKPRSTTSRCATANTICHSCIATTP